MIEFHPLLSFLPLSRLFLFADLVLSLCNIANLKVEKKILSLPRLRRASQIIVLI